MPRLIFFLLLVLASAPVDAAIKPPTVEEGEIAGAKFFIALPAQWNRRVLLLAHGLRFDNTPLITDLDPQQPAYKKLLGEGWIVATTSFRRNGIILADAIADLDALRAHIVAHYGAPERVIVEGESMGGLIAVLIAEREPELYSGVVALSAALQLKDPRSDLGLSLQSKIPVLFVANQSEIEAPWKYIGSKLAVALPTVRPILFTVTRGGHVNVNQAERLFALRALNVWIEHGPNALPRPASGERFVDITAAPDPQPSQVTVHADGRGFDTRITGFAPAYGNASLDAQPADFAAAGIKPFTWFQVTLHGNVHRALFGKDFSNVKKGEWVAFPLAEGNVMLGRNLADAAATESLVVGDVVSIHRFADPK